jgi:hypothetical protein
MPVETAGFVNQLKPNQPQGGESISEGDDHLRVIKGAIVGSFPNINAVVTATPADLNAVGGLVTDVSQLKTELDALDKTAHGNVASCYYNPTANPKIVYSHNVSSVIKDPNDLGGFQTRVVFNNALPDFNGPGYAHFAFNITPVSGTGYPTLITVVAAEREYVSFLSWHLVNEEWVHIPGTEVGFSLMVNDMDAGQ